MPQFISLPVTDVRRETPDCVSIALDASAHPAFLQFLPGQYLTFDLKVNGQMHRRSYSICSTPGSGELRIAAKAVEGGTCSVYLNTAVRPGDRLDTMLPEGQFVPKLDNLPRHFVLFGAGSGITPLMSMVRPMLEAGHWVTLFYGNRNRESIIFREQLDAIDHARFRLQHILTDDSHSGEDTGRIDAAKTKTLVAQLTGTAPLECFVCGPNGMMASVLEGLAAAGIAEGVIHTEYFTPPDESPASDATPENTAFDGSAQVSIVLDDETTAFTLAENGDVILDAALDAGLDAPFSCKGGVCTTCRAKLIEGTVRMDANYALTEGEVAEGYILTCQSHPTAAVVKVSYDEA